MHARNPEYRAVVHAPGGSALEDAIAFLRRRVDDLDREGIARERLLVDPGMGLFLSKEPGPSLEVLGGLGRLRREVGRPVYLSTSRKSFIGNVLGGRPPLERAAGTLATEIWAAAHGADYIRTHEPRALRDALAVWQSVAN
jgi:dihydropteroate synthase